MNSKFDSDMGRFLLRRLADVDSEPGRQCEVVSKCKNESELFSYLLLRASCSHVELEPRLNGKNPDYLISKDDITIHVEVTHVNHHAYLWGRSSKDKSKRITGQYDKLFVSDDVVKRIRALVIDRSRCLGYRLWIELNEHVSGFTHADIAAIAKDVLTLLDRHNPDSERIPGEIITLERHSFHRPSWKSGVTYDTMPNNKPPFNLIKSISINEDKEHSYVEISYGVVSYESRGVHELSWKFQNVLGKKVEQLISANGFFMLASEGRYDSSLQEQFQVCTSGEPKWVLTISGGEIIGDRAEYDGNGFNSAFIEHGEFREDINYVGCLLFWMPLSSNDFSGYTSPSEQPPAHARFNELRFDKTTVADLATKLINAHRTLISDFFKECTTGK